MARDICQEPGNEDNHVEDTAYTDYWILKKQGERVWTAVGRMWVGVDRYVDTLVVIFCLYMTKHKVFKW
jgi:hypothetical protein